MQKCYVITAYIEGSLSQIISPKESDFIICADGGYENSISCNIIPDVVIGDFDSSNMPPLRKSCMKVIRHPAQKDESDTFLCIKYAIERGFSDIVIVGGMGGRLDHTISNIQTMAHFCENGKTITMIDEKNSAHILFNTQMRISKKEGFHLSLFSLSDVSVGVTCKGLAYPLFNATLQNTYPLGLSNVFCQEEAFIEVRDGKILVIISRD